MNASTEKPRPVDSLTDLEERLSLWCQFREPLPLVKYASVAELLSASLFYIREQRQSFAALSKHNEALRDELDLTKAGLEFAKDAAFRLSGISAEQYSKSDVEAICSIAIAAVNRQNKVTLDQLNRSRADMARQLQYLLKHSNARSLLSDGFIEDTKEIFREAGLEL